jgi:hypothetical protein
MSENIPAGWKLVPIEPTDAMVDAGRVARMNVAGGYEGPSGWQAMLDAAPPAPTHNVVGIISAFEQAHPELYWHVAKGKICEGEPLYGAAIFNSNNVEMGHGESDEGADDAFRIAIDVATSRIRAALAAEGRE